MKKMAMREAASMPPMTMVPSTWRETAPAPLASPQRNAAEDKGECGHEDGPEPQSRPGERGVKQRFAGFVFGLGELDDEDGVFGRKADQHNEADLRVDIVV